MVMQSMHSGKGSGFIKFVFFTLLVLATFGLVLTDVGGFFRGGVSVYDVAKVGDKKISVVEFDRAARRTLARANITTAQALQLGYMNQILNSEIRRSLFQQIAADNDIKISREEVAKQINEMVEGSVREGQSKQEVLDQMLMNQGFKEAEFVSTVAAEGAAGILARAIQTPYLGYSSSLLKDLFFYQNETRAIEYVSFLNKDYSSVNDPTDEELQHLYDATKETYAIPENREITVAIIDDSEILSTISITDEQVRDVYDEDLESHQVPERRVLQQAVVKDHDKALEIFQAVKGEKTLKEAVVDVMGDDKSYLAAQPFQKDGLIESISDVVFTANEVGQNFEPIQSPLGWHVIHLVKINKPFTKSFDNAKEQIRAELLADEKAEQQFELATRVDDLLAGGATIEDIKNEVKLELTPITDVTRAGAMASEVHPLDKFGEDQKIITEMSFEYFEGEASPVTELGDGRLAFVQIDKIIAKGYKPFSEVKNSIKTRWVKDQQRLDNRGKIIEILNSANTEEYGIDKIAKDNAKTVAKLEGLKRNGDVQAPFTPRSIAPIFEASVGELVMIELNDGFAIANIISIDFPKEAKEETDEITALKQNLEKSSTSEAINSFFEKKRDDYNVVVNPSVLDRVYGSNQTQ